MKLLSLFRRMFCHHEWMVGRHPVTLAITSRICQWCGRKQYASIRWDNLPWPASKPDDELQRLSQD